MRLWRILLNAQGADGGNGNGSGNTPPPTPPPADDKGVDLVKAVEGLVAKHGDTTAALRVLLGENYSYRDQLRDAKAKLPADGAVVLTGDHAKDWEHYRALGKPADLKTGLAERDTFKAEAGTFRKAEVVRSAAELHGYKSGVLGKLAEGLDLVVGELKDDRGAHVGKDGKPLPKDAAPVRVAFVKGEGEKLTRLDDHARANWADFLPSLEIKAEAPKPIGTPRHNVRPPVGQGAERNGGQQEPPKRPRSGF